MDMRTEIESGIREGRDRWRELRRDIHRHPEPRFEEKETSRKVAERLRAAGLEVRREGAGTGVVAVVRGGQPGRTVALRADMDALPIAEETGAPHTSLRSGVMHACGHDGHTTTLVAVGEVLARLRPSLTGNVVLLFQPAEEGGFGAVKMIEAGVLDDPRVEAIFAVHSWPPLEAGVIGFRYGAMMASSDYFKIRVHGRGGHASSPHLCIDPVPVACRIVTALQEMVSRETDPVDSVVLTVGKLHGGTASNAIPDDVTLEGTIRTLHEKTRARMRERVEAVAKGLAAAARAEAEVELPPGYASLTNHADMVTLGRRVAEKLLGAAMTKELEVPSMGAEDFTYFLHKVPGALFRLGVARPGEACPPLHSNRFDFNDEALPNGVRFFCGVALAFLQGDTNS